MSILRNIITHAIAFYAGRVTAPEQNFNSTRYDTSSPLENFNCIDTTKNGMLLTMGVKLAVFYELDGDIPDKIYNRNSPLEMKSSIISLINSNTNKIDQLIKSCNTQFNASSSELTSAMLRNIINSPPTYDIKLAIETISEAASDVHNVVIDNIENPWLVIPQFVTDDAMKFSTLLSDEIIISKINSGLQELTNEEIIEAKQKSYTILNNWKDKKRPLPAIQLLSYVISRISV